MARLDDALEVVVKVRFERVQVAPTAAINLRIGGNLAWRCGGQCRLERPRPP
jgi:hypothetical protein